MLTASQYVSTGNLAIFDRELSSSGFVALNGITYLTTIDNYLNILKNQGFTYFVPFTNLTSGSTLNGQARFYVNVYKTLGPNRCGMQNFNSHTLVTSYFDDRLTVPGRSLTLNTSTGTTLATNSWYSPWPVAGVTALKNYITPWFTWLKGEGVTLNALMLDWEGTPYASDNLINDTDLINPLIGASQFYQSYYGLSSCNELFAYYNGVCSGSFQGQNRYAWWPVNQAYVSKAFEMALLEPLLNAFPDAIMSNYKMYEEDYVSPINGEPNYLNPEYNSQRQTTILCCGNAHGNELYGSMLEANYRTVNSLTGKRLDPWNSLSGITNNFRQFNKQVRRGPWSSFILVLAEARASKRGRPDLPLNPWVGPVNWSALEYARGYLEHKLVGGYDPQSSPGALHTTWFKNNLTVSSGFTAYDGSTSAFRIITNSGINNASLEYYFNGISAGTTYVFSYYTNLDTGFTNPANVYQKVEHFTNWTYYAPRGITFNRILPGVTGPFFNIGYQDLTGYSGWTKVEIEFNPTKLFSDITDNNTLSVSVFGCCGATVSGVTSFFSHPSFSIKSSPSNIPLFVRSPTDEYHEIGYRDAPPIGFSNLVAGYNPESAMYVDRPGNSAYYYEYIMQLALLGTKHFGYFTGPLFSNYGFTGSLQNWVNRGKSPNIFFTSSFALQNGWTGYLTYEKEFNDTLHDVNTRIGGFTLTTADYGEYDWNLPYFANGAPSLNGTTWWFRVTVKPGYTMYINGETLSARGGYPVGAWYGTTGPTLANSGMTLNAWELPSEPGYTAPIKLYDFLGMTNNSQIASAGVSVTRSTIATHIGSSGYLVSAPANQGRLDFDPVTLQPKGLMVEAAATNLLNWSESFATSGGCNNNWIDINLSRTTGNTSPSGNTSAIRFTATASNSILISTSGVSASNIYGSWSCWFRGITGTEQLSVSINGGTTWKSIPISTNWKRYGSETTQKELGMTSSQFYMAFRLGNTNDSVEIWGAQVEQRITPWGGGQDLNSLQDVEFTSYINSGATRGFRGADRCRVTGSSFTSWYGITQGTFLFDFTNIYTVNLSISTFYTNPLYYQIDSTSAVRIARGNQSASTETNTYWPYPQNGYPKNIPIKTIFTYDPRGIKISCNGFFNSSVLGVTAETTSYDSLNLAVVSGQLWDSPRSQGYIRKVMYWNYVWNDSDLVEMSKANVEPTGIFNPYG